MKRSIQIIAAHTTGASSAPKQTIRYRTKTKTPSAEIKCIVKRSA
ncbi:MAG: hypothetical protein PHY09_08480 [Desulfuromonadaceae bacterium]|nr:hypothetical protein [Desulfuromonadaceae bacterium]MDD5106837.1 hypothetical protein [Desulfuromonadaceae bacterium]